MDIPSANVVTDTFKKDTPVLVIPKDLPFFDPASINMMNSTGIIDS